MTWKEFKDAVERRGVKDEDEIWYIDVHRTRGESFQISFGPLDSEDPCEHVAIWS